MITNGRVRSEEPNMAASFSGLTHDIIELAELQTQLFALDLKQTSEKTRTSLLLAIVGVCLLLGSIPVALMALANVLVEQLGWSPAAGYGMATLVGILASAGLLMGAWARFRTGIGTLQRSREEFNRSIAWIKSSLRSRAQPTATTKD
jgi:uncharacterized membrane protein YqjE